MGLEPHDFFLMFREKRKASKHDAFSFYFTKEKDVDFLPGQYLKMTIPGNPSDERGNSRYFTIASSPTERDHIMITTRIMQSWFKHSLEALTPGEKIPCSGPYGNFVLDETNKALHVFLAGGIGMTPFRSMARYIHDKHLEIPITIIASFSTSDDILFWDELSEMEKASGNFSYHVTITQPERSTIPQGVSSGRIDAGLIKEYIANPFESYYYIVGPSIMVSSLFGVLKDMHIQQDKIRTENFPGY